MIGYVIVIGNGDYVPACVNPQIYGSIKEAEAWLTSEGYGQHRPALWVAPYSTAHIQVVDVSGIYDSGFDACLDFIENLCKLEKNVDQILKHIELIREDRK